MSLTPEDFKNVPEKYNPVDYLYRMDDQQLRIYINWWYHPARDGYRCFNSDAINFFPVEFNQSFLPNPNQVFCDAYHGKSSTDVYEFQKNLEQILTINLTNMMIGADEPTELMMQRTGRTIDLVSEIILQSDNPDEIVKKKEFHEILDLINLIKNNAAYSTLQKSGQSIYNPMKKYLV